MGFRIVATARYIDPVNPSGGPITTGMAMQDIQNTGLPSPPEDISPGHMTLPLPAHSSQSTYPPYDTRSIPLKLVPIRPSKMSSGLPIQQMIPGLRETIEVMPPEGRPPEIMMSDHLAGGDEWMWRPRPSFKFG